MYCTVLYLPITVIILTEILQPSAQLFQELDLAGAVEAHHQQRDGDDRGDEAEDYSCQDQC